MSKQSKSPTKKPSQEFSDRLFTRSQFFSDLRKVSRRTEDDQSAQSPDKPEKAK